MSDKQQFNIRLPKVLADRVRMDCVRTGQTQDAVVGAILRDFFASWTATDRSKFYGNTTKRRIRKSPKDRAVSVEVLA